MEINFVKADSRNLLKIDAIVIGFFFQHNPNFNAAELKNLRTAISTPWKDMHRAFRDGLSFPKHLDDVLSPPDAALEHAEHLLLATRLQLSQLSSCLHGTETATLTHDRKKKLNSAEDREKIIAEKAVLNCHTAPKHKELERQSQKEHHKKNKSKKHMPGCRYHKDSVHEQKQSGDQEQNHDKDLVSQMTSRSHLEWQFLPSVNIKQNFQIQQGPTVSVPRTNHKLFTHSNSNIQVIETVHNSYEDNCNEKLNQFSSISESKSSSSASMQLKMDNSRRNRDKINFDTKFKDSEPEFSLCRNKVPHIPQNELNSNKRESETCQNVKFSTYDSKFSNKTSQNVHNNTFLNHQTQLETKGMMLQHKKKTGGSKTLPRQGSKPHKRKPIVCRPSYTIKRTPKISVYQMNSQINNSLLQNSMPSKNNSFQSDDTLSNKTQKSCDGPSKVIQSSISNVGCEKDIIISSTPQFSVNIHTNSEIEQSNQTSQSHIYNVVDKENKWHTQLNTAGTSTKTVGNNDAKMYQLESTVFDAISSEVLSGLLHNVQCTSSQNPMRKLDLEIHQKRSMIQNLQSKYSPNDKSFMINNDGDQSYEDDFEDEEDMQNKDKCNQMESSEIVPRISSPSDNSESTCKKENSEVQNINDCVVENNSELNQISQRLSPKQISNLSSTLSSSSPPSLSKELSPQDILEVTAKTPVISPKDFNDMSTPPQECSLPTTPVSIGSFSYFPMDFYKSLQPNISVKETMSQEFVSKESQENTTIVSPLISDSSTASQTEMNLTGSLSLGEIAPEVYSFSSLLKFQKMDLNLADSLSCGEVNLKVTQLQSLCRHNKPYQAQCKNRNDLPDNPHRLNVEHSEGELSDSLEFFNNSSGIKSSSWSHQQ